MHVALIENTGKDFFISRIRLAKYLKSKGLIVTVIIPNDGFKDQITSSGFNVILVGKNIRGKGLLNKLKFVFDLYKILKTYDFDVIHCFRLQPNIIGGFLGGVVKCKTVINHVTGLGTVFTKTGFRFKIQKLFIIYCYRFNNLVFNTKYIFQNAQDVVDIGINKNYCIIKGSAVNEDVFYPKKVDSGKHLAKEKTILFVSRLIKSKGLEYLVSAVNELNMSSKKDSIKLTIVGWIDPQNSDSYSKKAIAEFQKNDKITFLGERRDIASLINSSDICALPTFYREGTPRFLLEAMACAKPIITTNMPGCSHLINNDFSNGIIVSTKNSTEIVNAIKKILQGDPIKMGEAGRKKYLKVFSEEVVYSGVYKFYN